MEILMNLKHIRPLQGQEVRGLLDVERAGLVTTSENSEISLSTRTRICTMEERPTSAWALHRAGDGLPLRQAPQAGLSPRVGRATYRTRSSPPCSA